jgi:hypothetical protein
MLIRLRVVAQSIHRDIYSTMYVFKSHGSSRQETKGTIE